MLLRVLPVVLLLAVACHKAPPVSPAEAAPTVLDRARAREIPDPLLGRFTFAARSERLDLSASTGGAVILDRPGHGHLAVLGPFGGTLLTVQTDGSGLAVEIPRLRRHLAATDAEQALRTATGGAAGIDDLLALLAGDVPLDEAEVRSVVTRDDGLVEVALAGAEGSEVHLVLDAASATPVEVEVTRDGVVLVGATYGPFAPRLEDGLFLPTRVDLWIGPLDLSLDVRFRSWATPDPVPDVFGQLAPPGYTSEPLWEIVRQAAGRLSADGW